MSSPEGHCPENRFSGEQVGGYDSGIRRMLPGYELLHELTRSLLHAELPGNANVLVAGCGTGMEIASLGERHPRWRFTGVDPSEDMVAIARGRVAERRMQSRVELRVGLTDELPASPYYDAATALLVMHFLPDDGGKLDFLTSIADRLRADAPLVLADACGEPASERFAGFISAWRQRQLALGMEEPDRRAVPRRAGGRASRTGKQDPLAAQGGGFLRHRTFLRLAPLRRLGDAP